jgi:hypothetical protein
LLEILGCTHNPVKRGYLLHLSLNETVSPHRMSIWKTHMATGLFMISISIDAMEAYIWDGFVRWEHVSLMHGQVETCLTKHMANGDEI